MYLAGLYQEIFDPDTGEVTLAFAIKTTAYSNITIQAQHHRSPVITPDAYIFQYLDPKAHAQHLTAFYPPPSAEGFQAYQVDPIIAKRNCPLPKDDPKLIAPIGDILSPIL